MPGLIWIFKMIFDSLKNGRFCQEPHTQGMVAARVIGWVRKRPSCFPERNCISDFSILQGVKKVPDYQWGGL